MNFNLFETLTELDKINESLQELGNDKGYIVDEYELRDLIVNKPKAYRILYDANIDKYLVGDANDYIHADLFEQALKDGWYLDAHNDNEYIQELIDYMNEPRSRRRGDYDSNYVEIGDMGDERDDGEYIEPYLLYMIWVPSGIDAHDISGSPYVDGYNKQHYFENIGTMFTRYADPDLLKNNALFKLLDRMSTN